MRQAPVGVDLFVAGMIGQYKDGPRGGVPEWLAAVTWFLRRRKEHGSWDARAA